MDAEHLKRILIVDDESDVTELLDYKFKQAGYAIRTLNDPLRAIGLARDFRPDLIILDVMMPELTGVQLLRMVLIEFQGAHTADSFRQPTQHALVVALGVLFQGRHIDFKVFVEDLAHRDGFRLAFSFLGLLLLPRI